MAKICCICGRKVGVMEATHPYDEYNNVMCDECYRNYNTFRPMYWDNRTDEEIDKSFKYMESHTSEGEKKICDDIMSKVTRFKCGYDSFLDLQETCAKEFPEQETKKVSKYFALNLKAKKFAVLLKGRYQTIHDFNDLLDFEVKEDGVSTLSGTMGAAAIGAVLAGTTGALIGQSKSRKMNQVASQLDIILTFKEISMPAETIHILQSPIAKEAEAYKQSVSFCNEIISLLKQIINDNKTEEDKGNNSKERKARAIYAFSVADEIRKFKELADEGVITQAEFETQKKKLLSLDY